MTHTIRSMQPGHRALLLETGAVILMGSTPMAGCRDRMHNHNTFHRSAREDGCVIAAGPLVTAIVERKQEGWGGD